MLEKQTCRTKTIIIMKISILFVYYIYSTTIHDSKQLLLLFSVVIITVCYNYLPVIYESNGYYYWCQSNSLGWINPSVMVSSKAISKENYGFMPPFLIVLEKYQNSAKLPNTDRIVLVNNHKYYFIVYIQYTHTHGYC